MRQCPYPYWCQKCWFENIIFLNRSIGGHKPQNLRSPTEAVHIPRTKSPSKCSKAHRYKESNFQLMKRSLLKVYWLQHPCCNTEWKLFGLKGQPWCLMCVDWLFELPLPLMRCRSPELSQLGRRCFSGLDHFLGTCSSHLFGRPTSLQDLLPPSAGPLPQGWYSWYVEAVSLKWCPHLRLFSLDFLDTIDTVKSILQQHGALGWWPSDLWHVVQS